MLNQRQLNIKFIIVGDFNQLKPVNDRINVQYKNSLALFELCQGNRLQLSTCRRSDNVLFNMCKFKNIMNVQKSTFKNQMCLKNIAYLHVTRIKINEKLMKERVKKYHKKKDIIRLEKSIFDPHSQNVILCPNTPIISKINNMDLNIINNECFTINKIVDDNINISNDVKELVIHKDDFQKFFYVAYCITIHSSQGETFTEPYTIHDWNILDKHLRYVALTRLSNIEYINIA